MKSKFNNSPYASDAFGNNLRDEALKFQLDHEVAKEVKIKLNGNRYTFTLYSADGNVVGEDYFESDGKLISVELVPEKNFVTQEKQTPGLRFHFENGQEIFCDFTHLHDKLVHRGEEDDYYEDEHIYGTKYFNGDQYFNDTIKVNKEETKEADILTANIKDAKVETADILAANVDKANINVADVLTENVEKANIKTIDALNANIKSGNIEAVNVGTANITNGNIENETVNTAEIITANIGTANIDTLEARDVKLDEIDVRDAEVENAAINEEHTNHATIIRADIGLSGTGTADIQDANIYTKLSIKAGNGEDRDAEFFIEPQAASKLETQPDFAALKINAAGKVISEDYTNTTDTPEETDSATFVYVDKVSTNSAGKIIENTSKIVTVAEGDAQGQFKLNNVNINVNNLGTDDRPSFTGLDSTDDVAISSDKLLKVDNIKTANGTENIASVDKTNHIINIGDDTNDVHIKNDLVVDETAHITKDTTIGNNKIILDADAGNITTAGKAIIENGLEVNNGTSITGSLIVNATDEFEHISISGPVNINGVTSISGNTSITGNVVKIDGKKTSIIGDTEIIANKNGEKLYIEGPIDADGSAELDGSLIIHSSGPTGAILATVDLLGTDPTKVIVDANSVEIDSDTTIHGNVSITGGLNVAATVADHPIYLEGPVIINTDDTDEGVEITGPITATGSVDINGPIGATGNVAIYGNVGVTGTVDIANNTHLKSDLIVDQNTAIGGTLGVTGATILANTLSVSGSTSLHDTLTVDDNKATILGGTLEVTQKATLKNNLEVKGNTQLDGNLSVTGTTVLANNLTVNANETVNGNVTIDGLVSVTGATNLNGNVHVTGTIESTGNILTNSDLYVEAQKTSSGTENALKINSSGKVEKVDLTVISPTKDGKTLEYIDTISQDSIGKISATKKEITLTDGGQGTLTLNDSDITITNLTTSGKPTFSGITITDSVGSPTDAATKEYVDTVDNKLNYNVHTEGNTDEITYNGDTVTKTSPHRNLKTGVTGSRIENIHLANETTAGLMSYSDYNQIRTNTARIASLEGTAVRIIFEKADPADPDPTASDIKDFARDYIRNQKGDPTYTPTDNDYTGVSVRTSFNNNIWNYYANTQVYKDDGLDTVTQFTNEIAGIILGCPSADAQSNIINEGKVFAESDGTGSVIGWTTLKTRVTNVENEVATKLTKITSSEPNNKARLYIINSDGSQGVTTLDENSTGAYTIPLRDSAGNIKLPTPVNTADATNKNYVDTIEAEIKRDYVPWFSVSKAAGGATVVQRNDDSSVDIRVPVTPVYDNEPASKKYVDDADTNIKNNYVHWSSVSQNAGTGETIVQRKADSKVDIRVPDPTYDDEPASKGYVDNTAGTIRSATIKNVTLPIDGFKNLEIPAIRFDINNQGLDATQKANVKANIGIDDLDFGPTGGDGKYIRLVSQTNGQVAAEAADFDTEIPTVGSQITPSETTAPTTKAVRDYVEDNAGTIRAIKLNNQTPYVPDNKTITIVADETPTDNSTNLVLSGGVKTYIDNEAGTIREIDLNGNEIQPVNKVVNIVTDAEPTADSPNLITSGAVRAYVDDYAGTIRIIRVNNTALIPDQDKAVDITVPEVIDMR